MSIDSEGQQARELPPMYGDEPKENWLAPDRPQPEQQPPAGQRADFEASIRSRHPGVLLTPHPDLPHRYALGWLDECWDSWQAADFRRPQTSASQTPLRPQELQAILESYFGASVKDRDSALAHPGRRRSFQPSRGAAGNPLPEISGPSPEPGGDKQPESGAAYRWPLAAGRECLQDVISHAGDFAEAIKLRRRVAEEEDKAIGTEVQLPAAYADPNASYWDHQMRVLRRMVERATFALGRAAVANSDRGGTQDAAILAVAKDMETAAAQDDQQVKRNSLVNCAKRLKALAGNDAVMVPAPSARLPDAHWLQSKNVRVNYPDVADGASVVENGSGVSGTAVRESADSHAAALPRSENPDRGEDDFCARPAPRLTDAEADVLAERRRQVDLEGFAAAGDDAYSQNELARAAAVYACPALAALDGLALWPWSQAWLKLGDPRRNLVKAGALILADIERIDRAAGGVPSTANRP